MLLVFFFTQYLLLSLFCDLTSGFSCIASCSSLLGFVSLALSFRRLMPFWRNSRFALKRELLDPCFWIECDQHKAISVQREKGELSRRMENYQVLLADCRYGLQHTRHSLVWSSTSLLGVDRLKRGFLVWLKYVHLCCSPYNSQVN